jgi:uncharacterized protein YgiM (DUF1202 family)
MKSKLRSLFIALSLALVVALGVGPALATGASQQAQFAVPILIANTSFLNIRTGPGAEYTVLVTVVGGTEMPVLGIAGDGVWYLVATSVGNGWVNADYVIPRGDFRNVPEIDSAYAVTPVVVPWTPITIGLPQDAGQGGGIAPYGTSTVERFRAAINVESVNLRATPSMEGPVLRILFMDDSTDYAIVGRTNVRNVEWLAIDVPGVGSGWIESAKLHVRLSGRYRDVLTVVGESVGVLQVPMGHFLSVPPLQQGDEVFLLETSLDGQLVKVELPTGEAGWIPFASVVGRENTTTDGLYVAGSPAPVPYYEDGQGGGVAPGYVAVPVVPAGVPVVAAPTAIVNTGNLNIRSGPGAQFTTVATVPGGTQLGVIAIASDDVWYLVAGAFGQGWINKEFVIIRGNLSVVPTIPWSEAAAQAAVQAPVAVVSVSLVLYAAPGTQYAQVGTLVGPAEVAVVARTADFNWVQLSTAFGYGWVPVSQVVLRGDANLIPTV